MLAGTWKVDGIDGRKGRIKKYLNVAVFDEKVMHTCKDLQELPYFKRIFRPHCPLLSTQNV